MTIWHPALDQRIRPRYRALVEALERDIVSGRLGAGQRLPTHRALADVLGLSVGTVTRAYAEAEAKGLAHGEIGRGSFVGPGPSPGPLIGGTSGQRPQFEMAALWPLYALDPDPAPVFRRLARRRDLLQYQPHAGMAHHRAAGTAWARHCGLPSASDRIVVCGGIQHAILTVLASLCEPGDTVLTDTLTYPGVRAAANVLRLRVHGVAMDDHGIRPDSLASACRQRRAKVLYLMPTLHNPTTATIPERRRREIASVVGKHGVAVIEDDVHRLLEQSPPPPVAEFAPDLTYFIAGFSKTVVSGLRVAFVVAPLDRVERLTTTIAGSTWMTAPLSAEIASQWIGDGTAAATAKRKRAEAAKRQAMARRVLAGVPYRSGRTGFHLWLPLPAPWRGATFASEAQRRGVTVAPAELFAVTADTAPAAVRVSLSAVPDHDSLRQGLETIRALIQGATTVAMV